MALNAPILQNLTKTERAHVAIYTASNDGINFICAEQFDGGVDGGKAGSAGRVGDEVGAAQIEHIGHPPGDDVGQFAGHGVFSDSGNALVDGAVPFADNLFTHVFRKLIESVRGLQGVGILGEDDAVLGDVMHFPAHRCAQDDACFFSV